MSVDLLDTTWAIDGVTFNTRDDNGVEWLLGITAYDSSMSTTTGSGDDGWYNGPGEKLKQVDMPIYDGVFDTQPYRDVRLVTLSGAIVAPDRVTMDRALRQFAAIGTGKTISTLVVTDPLGTLQAQVRRAQKPNLSRVTSNYTEFQLFLVAPDPRRYDVGNRITVATGLPSTSSGLDWSTNGGLDWSTGGGLYWGSGVPGTVYLSNPGTAESWPSVTIAGPTDAGTLIDPSITNSATGDQILYSGTLNTGDTLTISTSPYDYAVLLNGSTDVRAYLTSAQWFSIDSGQSVMLQFQGRSTSTTPQLIASLDPAYW